LEAHVGGIGVGGTAYFDVSDHRLPRVFRYASKNTSVAKRRRTEGPPPRSLPNDP
jgi:hypothetical protein